MGTSAHPALDRRLGFWGLWALGVGAVVDDGIFVLLGQGIQTAGPGAVPAFLVAGLFQLFLMVALGELAVGMPDAGAMSAWVGRLAGDWWGILAGFAFALGWVFAGGSVGLAIGKLTCWFFVPEPTPFWIATFAVGFLTLFAACNVLGVELAVRTQLLLVVLLVGLMTVFALGGVGSVRADHFAPMLPHGWGGFWLAVPLGTYAYLGAVTLTTAGGECREPRDLPRALIWASVTFLLLYTAAQVVLQGVVRWDEVTGDVPPFTLAAERVFGPSGAWVMTLGAWLAAATTLLMGTIYAPSRIWYSQARAGYLPPALGRVHPRTRAPVAGIALVWAASVGLVLWGVRDFDYYYGAFSLQLVFAWMVSWGLALLAAVLYRRRFPDEVRGLPWRQPLYPVFPALGLVGIAVVTWFTFEAEPLTPVIGVGWVAALAAYYRVVVVRRIRPAAASPACPEAR
jgi:amino acid transporter